MSKKIHPFTGGLCGLFVVATTLAVSSSPGAAPHGNYYSTWQSQYPGSQTGANVVSGTGSSCQLCHVSGGGGNNFNGYGKKIYDLRQGGSSTQAAIIGAGLFDTDGDPFADISDVEIAGDTQPGWTAGPHNTHYNKSGVTATDQTPPTAILGNRDRCEAPASETVRLGSPANPNAFLPGVTSGPIVGQVWDPRVDHATFHPTAILDLMIVDLGAPLNVVTPYGTLLCNIPPSSQFFTSAPGVPFVVSVPLSCFLVGLPVCSQAASYAPGSTQLANALDLVVGSY